MFNMSLVVNLTYQRHIFVGRARDKANSGTEVLREINSLEKF